MNKQNENNQNLNDFLNSEEQVELKDETVQDFSENSSELDSKTAELPVKKPTSKKKKALRITLISLGAIILTGTILIGTALIVGRQQLGQKDVDLQVPSDIYSDYKGQRIVHNNKTYVYNQDITSILCLGVDKNSSNLGIEDKVIGENGQADAIYLIVIDTKSHKYNVIGISRDAIVDIDTYSTEGVYVGISKTQLCLAYAYGKDSSDVSSCENIRSAVGRMFYNIPIKTYFSINRSAIPVLNDAIGGVVVPVYDKNGNKTGDTKRLLGDEAEEYLRYRDTSYLDSNEIRMKKQIDYIKSFAKTGIDQAKMNLSVPINLFNIMNNYSTTDLTAPKITYLTTTAFANQGNINLEFSKVEGKVIEGEDGYAEYIVDNDKLRDLILKVFYKEEK